MAFSENGSKPENLQNLNQGRDRSVGSEHLALKALKATPNFISHFSILIPEMAEERPLASPCWNDVISVYGAHFSEMM